MLTVVSANVAISYCVEGQKHAPGFDPLNDLLILVFFVCYHLDICLQQLKLARLEGWIYAFYHVFVLICVNTYICG